MTHKGVVRRTVLVEPYDLIEKNKDKMKICQECDYLASWEVYRHLTMKPDKFYACADHLETVVYQVSAQLLGGPEPEKESE